MRTLLSLGAKIL